jgi:hypothetical protein
MILNVADIKWGDILQPRVNLPIARMVSPILSDMYSVQCPIGILYANIGRRYLLYPQQLTVIRL